MRLTKRIVCLEARLKGLGNVEILGAKPNFSDYSPDAARMILEAPKIYYPSSFYAELFDTLKKPIFPGVNVYRSAQDKIRQTALFHLADIPHPRTRMFYGKRQKARIPDLFSYPFVAKIPRGQALGRGVFLIENKPMLETYLEKTDVAYIQEYLPVKKDLRVVVVGRRVMIAYWRVPADGGFLCNVSAGADIDFSGIPKKALDLAVHTAGTCGWDDVGIDILVHEDNCYVIEANMKYGRQGFKKKGIDWLGMMGNLIETGVI